MRSFNGLKGLKSLALHGLLCADEDLLFVLRQLPNLKSLTLIQDFVSIASSRSSTFFRVLFSELDYEQLNVTFDLQTNIVNEETLQESFPSECRAKLTKFLAVNVPYFYYPRQQLELITESFARMIGSGSFANLTTVDIDKLLLQQLQHFEAIRDGCPKLEKLIWSSDDDAIILDCFPQRWKCLRRIKCSRVKVAEAGLRQMATSSSSLDFIYTTLQVESETIKEAVLQAVKKEFPKICFLCH